MSLCKSCISGVRHEGTPEGKWEKIGGVETYVATPTIDYPKDKAVLFLTDVFGPQLINSQLLADDFAKNGFKTFIPDYLNGDPAPADGLTPGNTTGFDLGKWIGNHGPETVTPVLNNVIAALKKEGITSFAAAGYCFGGRYVFNLAFENTIKAAAVAHPSLLQVPADLETYAAKSRVPLLINSCPVDGQFPPASSKLADEILGDGKFAPGYKRVHWEGCEHGFAVRGDLSQAKVKEGKEGAFKETVEWFLKHM